MGVYKDHEAEEKQGDQERKVKRSLFVEAIMLLKATVAQRGKKDKTDLMLLQATIGVSHREASPKVKSLKIRNLKFDLQKYYARFHKIVRLLETIGVDMDDNYVLRTFANGCIEHRNLRTRTELVHLENFTNYHSARCSFCHKMFIWRSTQH